MAKDDGEENDGKGKLKRKEYEKELRGFKPSCVTCRLG